MGFTQIGHLPPAEVDPSIDISITAQLDLQLDSWSPILGSLAYSPERIRHHHHQKKWKKKEKKKTKER